MAKVNKFGTFGGVFVPSILTILGVIMYLRLPMIVGQAGLFMTLGIIILAHVISVTTGLSVSSIATDKKVEAGGTYYMISRSLGLPIGGTLGLALFVGLSFSVSLYLIGFSESFLGYWGYDVNINSIRIAGTSILVLVTTITLISTSLAIKTQYFIMTAIFLSLLSIAFGSHGFVPEAPNLNLPTTGVSFMLLFGIFFPAVTGFEAGVSMSGDLKDPKKSIPGGTITAILVGLVVYVLLALFFSFTVDKNILSGDSQVLLKISRVPELVVAGIWGATLSSALGSILGAPRILQATAVDKLTPRFFSKGVGKSNEPRNALLLTFLIAEAGILIGELDVIARIVSIFFITTYGFLNLSCAFEKWTSADFRPSFKTPIWISLLGAVACFLVMIQLDFIAAVGATVILGLLYFLLKRKELSLSSGDAWSGVWSSLVKSGLQKLDAENLHSRNWRPNLLMFAGSEERRPHMTQLGLAITGKLGLLSSFELSEEKVDRLVKIAKEEKRNGDAAYFKLKYKCPNLYKGISEITSLYGFAGIEPNTILMGWSERREKKAEFVELIKGLERSNLNSLFLHLDRVRKIGKGNSIDIWWSGWGGNLSLALNLIRHITSSEPWQRASIRLLIIQNQAGEVDRIFQQVQRILKDYRINIELKVLNNYADQNSRSQIIATESAKTDLTIVGIPDINYQNLEDTYDFVSELGPKLGTSLFINASSSFEKFDVLSESGLSKELEVGDQEMWKLPDLAVSKYTEVARDISKIDEYSRAVLKIFIEKTFRDYFQVDKKFNERLLELVGMTSKSIAKASSIEQPYRRSEAITRSRRYFIEHIKKHLINYQENDIKLKSEGLQAGIDWYLEHLAKDVNKFPKHLTINYNREEFNVKANDTMGLRIYKLRNRLMHPFSKSSIPISIGYREVATYFLRDNRYQFLSVLMVDFSNTVKEGLRQISDYISFCEINFERLVHAIDGQENAVAMATFSDSIIDRMKELNERSSKLLQLYEGRILLEYRKNLSQMSHYLERIQVNEDLEKKKRKNSFYLSCREDLLNFSSDWEGDHILGLNAVLANTHLLDFLGYLERELQRFKIKLSQWIVRESNEQVEQTKLALNKLKEGPIEARQPIIPAWNVDGSKLLEEFEDISDRLVSYAKTLPDEINIDSGELEGESTIPLNSLLIYLVEIRLTGPFYDYLETLQDKLMQSSLLIQDQANLSIFNIYNALAEDREKVAKDLMVTVLADIETEQKKMGRLAEEARDKLPQLLSALRDSMNITTLTNNVGEFSQLIRRHKGKQISSRLGIALTKLQKKIKNLYVGILYSQSKGILLAERLTDAESKTFSEQLLKAIDNVTPNQSLLSKMPHYYTMLFSGRSSISDNLWIKRPNEERQLEEALNRYRSGMMGIIVVLGERNAGKTALCKNFCERNFQDDRVYHLFSRDAGSVNPEEFDVALQKATRIEGDSREVFNSLVHGSVMVIHDFELWWERAGEEGLRTVQHIKELINDYSHKCLFVVNMNPFAFEVLKRTESLDNFSLGTVRCNPFNAFELRHLILSRHKSSGIVFSLGKKSEENINEISLARLFNRVFEYSRGNPGMAMNAWLCSIIKYQDKSMTIKMPEISNFNVLHKLPTIWSMISLQLLMHKRMSFEKICRVLMEPPENIKEPLQAMLRVGLIKMNNMEVYGLNPYIEFLLIKVFHEKEWI